MKVDFLRRINDNTIELRLHIQPRAARSEIVGLHGEALKIRLAAPPVDGKANTMLTAFLAKLLGIHKSAVKLKSGRQSRKKRLLITGIDENEIREKLR